MTSYFDNLKFMSLWGLLLIIAQLGNDDEKNQNN